VKRTRRLIWWPTEEYYDLTLRAAWDVLANPTKRHDLWRFLAYRKYAGVSLLDWPRRHEFDMYVRADAAARVWGSGWPGATQGGVTGDTPECIPELLPTRVEIYRGPYGGAALKSPCGLAVSAEGAVVIADTGNDRVVVLNRAGSLVRTFGGRCSLQQEGAGGCADKDGTGPLQTGDGQFLEPWSVAVSRDGRIFVADTWNSRIQAFDPVGRLLWKWGAFGSASGIGGDLRLLYGPRGLAVTPGGELLVADTGNKRVLRFREDGGPLGQIGGGGTIPGRFDEPVGIALDPESGDILVADAWNRRIQRFNPGMAFLKQWPVPGWKSRDAASKPYVAVDSQGNVFATDPAESRLLAFDPGGRVQYFIRALGARHGTLNRPTGVAADPADDSIWIGDSGNDRIVRLRLKTMARNRITGE
jgi:DNA-binding beta-propeller fold protein YncE